MLHDRQIRLLLLICLQIFMYTIYQHGITLYCSLTRPLTRFNDIVPNNNNIQDNTSISSVGIENASVSV